MVPVATGDPVATGHMTKNTILLTRFSRDGLDEVFVHEEDVLAWDSYYHEALEASVGLKLGKKVAQRMAADGLDYTLLTDDERTALDIVLASTFSTDHDLTLWPVMDAKSLYAGPLGAFEPLLERAEETGSEGLLRMLVEGRRLEVDEPPDGHPYCMLDPEESQTIAIHARSLLSQGGFSKDQVRDIEKNLLPVLDKVVQDEDWLMIEGQWYDCERPELRKAKKIPPGSRQEADFERLVKRRPKKALEILTAHLPKTSGVETKKTLDGLVTATRLLGQVEEQAAWERRRAELLAKRG